MNNIFHLRNRAYASPFIAKVRYVGHLYEIPRAWGRTAGLSRE